MTVQTKKKQTLPKQLTLFPLEGVQLDLFDWADQPKKEQGHGPDHRPQG
jgi:hypothetical protein